MKTYKLTVFEANGEKILDEAFQAGSNDEAKKLGEEKITEKGFEHKSYRCTSSDGKLLLFHQ